MSKNICVILSITLALCACAFARPGYAAPGYDVDYYVSLWSVQKCFYRFRLFGMCEKQIDLNKI